MKYIGALRGGMRCLKKLPSTLWLVSRVLSGQAELPAPECTSLYAKLTYLKVRGAIDAARNAGKILDRDQCKRIAADRPQLRALLDSFSPQTIGSELAETDAHSIAKCACEAIFDEIDLEKSYKSLSNDGELYKNMCDKYKRIEIPASDLPTVADRQVFAKCDSGNLYFGLDRPPDPVNARKCAYLERERGTSGDLFGEAEVLTMIYANGKGAARNFDLALKFACEIDSPYTRLNHLWRLQKAHWTGDDFDLCDDDSSQTMINRCASLIAGSDLQKLNHITEKWRPADRIAFEQLRKAAGDFFEASANDSTSLYLGAGSGAHAEYVLSKTDLQNGFVDALETVDRGQLPTFSAKDFHKSDAELNVIYSKIQTYSKTQTDPDTKNEGLKISERAWIRYRDAWVRFGQQRYPLVSSYSWRTWLTQKRIDQLNEMAKSLGVRVSDPI